MRQTWVTMAAGVAVAMVLASCASISVQPGTSAVTTKKPEMVYVADFSTARGDFAVDREGAELTDFKQHLQLMLQTAMVKDLTDRLVPAAPATPSQHPPKVVVWLVRGEFKNVQQGSRLLRSTVGFGAGGTKVETRVEVYNLAEDPNKPFLTFSTTGGSNAEPGAIASLTTDPLYLAIGGVSGVAHGLSEDTARTAREITAELSDYMYKRGWISEDQWIKPKHADGGNPW